MLWQGNSFCYLESHHGLSHSSEYARVYRQADSSSAGGFHWRLQVSGGGGVDDAAISGTGAEAHCVSLNREMHPNPYVIQTVYKNTNVALNWTDEEGVCLPMAVYGNADHGSYNMYIDSNHWWRAAVDNNGISKIHVMCVGYADPAGKTSQLKQVDAAQLADEPEML
jgi:hypothetical protein